MESKKTVIITGGTTGIGKATAMKFAENGYNVVVTSRDSKKETALKNEFKDKGFEVDFRVLDVRNEYQVRDVIQYTVAKYGKLDVMVNNREVGMAVQERVTMAREVLATGNDACIAKHGDMFTNHSVADT